jgi:hypothetical protein
MMGGILKVFKDSTAASVHAENNVIKWRKPLEESKI